jgi:hypothetical protein
MGADGAREVTQDGRGEGRVNARWLVGPKGAGGAPELTWEMGDGRWEMGVFLRGWEAGHLRHG